MCVVRRQHKPHHGNGSASTLAITSSSSGLGQRARTQATLVAHFSGSDVRVLGDLEADGDVALRSEREVQVIRFTPSMPDSEILPASW